MFSNCDENSIHNAEVLLLLLTRSQGLICFSQHPTSEEVVGAQEVERGHNWGSVMVWEDQKVAEATYSPHRRCTSSES